MHFDHWNNSEFLVIYMIGYVIRFDTRIHFIFHIIIYKLCKIFCVEGKGKLLLIR